MNSLVRIDNLKMVAAGSGVRALAKEPIIGEAVEISGAERPHVLTIGTAEPTPEDFAIFVRDSKSQFEGLGATVTNLHDFGQPPSKEEAAHKIGQADTIWVAGGDTLMMIDFWRQHGIDRELREAALRGTVMSGGSAGMLAWMEQGHSDYLSYRVGERGSWDFKFVKGLGLLAATGCPHYDDESKAGKREADFKEKLLRGDDLPVPGIGITTLAALAIADGSFKVVAAPDAVSPRAEVHILTKTSEGVNDEQLPIMADYQPLELLQ